MQAGGGVRDHTLARQAAAASRRKEKAKASTQGSLIAPAGPSLAAHPPLTAAMLYEWLESQPVRQGANPTQFEFLQLVVDRILVEAGLIRRERSITQTDDPLVWLLHGPPGTSKSHVLGFLRQLFELVGYTYGLDYEVVAFQAVNAADLKGKTIHSAFGFDRQKQGDKAASEEVAKKMAHWRWLIMDEVSLTDAKLLAQMEQRLRFADDALADQGRQLLWSGPTQGVTELTDRERCKDDWWNEVVDEMRAGQLSDANWRKSIATAAVDVASSEALQATDCDKEAKIRRVAAVPRSRYRGPICGMLPLAIGMKVALTQHLDRSTDKLLLKGTIGRVHSWQWNENDRLPSVVYVKFEKVGWQLDGIDEPGVYPIRPVTEDWYLDARRTPSVLKIKRRQVPLSPAYAMTAHSSQGKTLAAVLLDLNVDKKVDTTFGTVAASRVQELHRLVKCDGLCGIDKAAAGYLLIALYGRCRHSDLACVEDILHDWDDSGGYLEIRTAVHKTSRSIQKKTRLLPIVIPVIGVKGECWVQDVERAFDSIGLKLRGHIGGPIFRPPRKDGSLCKRGLLSSECSKFLQLFLDEPSSPHAEGEQVMTSHESNVPVVGFKVWVVTGRQSSIGASQQCNFREQRDYFPSKRPGDVLVSEQTEQGAAEEVVQRGDNGESIAKVEDEAVEISSDEEVSDSSSSESECESSGESDDGGNMQEPRPKVVPGFRVFNGKKSFMKHVVSSP
eukprot:symbB.v1.2.037656.t1/scaffold5622.1/size25200/1